MQLDWPAGQGAVTHEIRRRTPDGANIWVPCLTRLVLYRYSSVTSPAIDVVLMPNAPQGRHAVQKILDAILADEPIQG